MFWVLLIIVIAEVHNGLITIDHEAERNWAGFPFPVACAIPFHNVPDGPHQGVAPRYRAQAKGKGAHSCLRTLEFQSLLKQKEPLLSSWAQGSARLSHRTSSGQGSHHHTAFAESCQP